MNYFILAWLVCGLINFTIFVALKHKKISTRIRESEHLDLDGEEDDIEALTKIILVLIYAIVCPILIVLGTAGLALRLGHLMYKRIK
jgi:hypothetical protein